jgi:16S rRNA G966 N2-methylase RsmD
VRVGDSMANHLYYGDNLRVLRESIADESVDLIYLDLPFNSNASEKPALNEPSDRHGIRTQPLHA